MWSARNRSSLAQLDQGANKETRANQQNGRQCYLNYYQPPAQPHPMQARRCAACVFQACAHAGAHRLPCREHPKQKAGCQRNPHCEGQHLPIEMDLHRRRAPRSSERHWNSIASKIPERQSRRTAQTRKQQALRQYLP